LPLFSNIPRLATLDLAGRRVFVRCDFDVPRSPHGAVLDDRRLRVALPTLRALVAVGAKVFVASEYGPEEAPDERAAAGIASRLGELLGKEVVPAPKEISAYGGSMNPGDVVVLPNLWTLGDAETDPDRANDHAQAIARSIDVYVNEAFRASRETRMSTVYLPRLLVARGAGTMLGKELEAMELFLQRPQPPFVAVLGGARLRAKAPLLRSLFGRVQAVLFGGVLANTFLAAQGVSVGRSFVETQALDLASELLREAAARGVRVVLPSDVVVRDASVHPPALRRRSVTAGEVGPDDMIVDVAQETCIAYREVLVRANMTVWNGLLGFCDSEDTRSGTFRIAQAMTQATPYVLAVGDDTVAQLDYMRLRGQFRYVSTGGEAALEMLRGTVFPGVEALRS
jgi:phosphoglycerate kinase